MKLIILATFIACSHGAKLNRAYLPSNSAQTSGGSTELLQTPLLSSSSNAGRFRSQGNDNEGAAAINNYDGNRFMNEGSHQINAFGNYERPRPALEKNAAILGQVNENDGETYSYMYETENGIVVRENGDITNGVEVEGGYAYTGDDGNVYTVSYAAGQNGFKPYGVHLPTPPPIPKEILLALERNARDKAAGIYDDGSYNEGKYASIDGEHQTPNFGHSSVKGDVINVSNDDSVVVNSAQNAETLQRSSIFDTGISRSDQLSNGAKKTKVHLPTGQRFTGNRNAPFRSGSSSRRASFNPGTGYNY